MFSVISSLSLIMSFTFSGGTVPTLLSLLTYHHHHTHKSIHVKQKEGIIRR